MPQISTWIVTEGFAGTESQCRGLAAALGLDPVVKRVKVRLPWDLLPNRLWFRPLSALTRDSDPLTPPWPELVISSGNVGASLSVGIKRASGGRTCTVHIQHPKLDPRHFDLVIAPRHDGLSGPNVLQTRAALHAVTTAQLVAAANHWASRFSDLPRPLVAVLIGGANRRHRLTPSITGRLADELADLTRKYGAGLAVTPSRRTGAENVAILRQRLSGLSAYVWDGSGENPYLGLLGLADAIIVTEDSVSMTSEACATGKPVFVARLEGRSRRIGLFHAGLAADGITRPFTGSLDSWNYSPPDDTAHAAAEIRRRFGWPLRASD